MTFLRTKPVLAELSRAAAKPLRRLLDSNAPVLGRMGTLETRLARSNAEIRAAQALRYQVFVCEMAASASTMDRLLGRDRDPWDGVCDHLLVIETQGGGEQIVGTYRFLRSNQLRASGPGFYTAGEFDIAPMLARHDGLEFMELGRSCVLPQWRTKRTIELLWHGIWAYVVANKVDVMFGCASFPGTDISMLAEPLSLLHNLSPVTPQWAAQAAGASGIPLNQIEKDGINAKRALHALPPLIKGYLRLGAMFGPQAVIDQRFRATDVLVVLPVASINRRYVGHFGKDASRFAPAE